MGKKQKLFQKIQEKGLLWSYNPQHVSEIPDDVLLEHVMKYGDIDDIYLAREIYGKEHLQTVWERTIKYDSRFIKLSVFLARAIFGLDIEGTHLKKEIHDRQIFRNFNY